MRTLIRDEGRVMADDQDAPRLAQLTETTAFKVWFVDGTDGKEKPMKIDIANGDFGQIPGEVIAEALKMAPKVREALKEKEVGTADPGKIKQFAAAAAIDGDPRTLTDGELAAWMIAKSLSDPLVGKDGKVHQTFDNVLSEKELLG